MLRRLLLTIFVIGAGASWDFDFNPTSLNISPTSFRNRHAWHVEQQYIHAAEEVERSHFVHSFTSSCTMWIRCTAKSTRNGRKQLENARNSKKSVASIGYARSRGSRWRVWEHLSVSLSHYLSLCACASSGGSKLFEEIWCKKMSIMARKSQVERCL